MSRKASVTAKSNPLAGLPIINSETHGRHSMLDRVALALQRRYGAVTGLAAPLGLTQQELVALHYYTDLSLRPAQLPPDMLEEKYARWRTWFLLGGRGAGKTHAGAAAVVREARADPEARILIVGPTVTEIVKNQIEGPSGILKLAPPWFRPEHRKSKKQLVFPGGVVADYLSASDADKFRGYGYTFEWLDEVVAWRNDPVAVFTECGRVARGMSTRMRKLGLSPRKVITTTPAPTELFREILKDREGLVISRSSTMENAVVLGEAYIRQARAVAHSTAGRREYGGELEFDLDPAMFGGVDWTKSFIHPKKRPKEFDLIVVSVDPATGEKKGADMHGIVVVGIRQESDGLDHVYVLADLSMRSPEPSKWAKEAVNALRAWEPFAKRSWIFAETNTGGPMVKHTIHSIADVPVKTARAKQSKATRASPVSAYAESGYVHMVGRHKKLEEQLGKFTGAEGGHARDDRVDAMCWPIYKYVVKRRKNAGAAERAQAGAAQEDDDDDE
ncbi:terminase large subunit domain-containing protein [Myxococcus sp. NMCA1]|uniref:terminase large subunit domain-containing protein n=1 Tax=Myxococcus sp. NMCA1 TaxID=2996785 RepID=UPI00228627D3|nr:terminase family protein [Myxococcus sp. NMCA1]WAM28519.1 terminase family protein [Myxococcus sp. NMCA1]